MPRSSRGGHANVDPTVKRTWPAHTLVLLTPGRQSHDDSVGAMLARAFPELRVEPVTVRELLADRRTLSFRARNRLSAISEYGGLALRRRTRLSYYGPWTSYYFDAVKRAAAERLSESDHTISFQTESLFDASVPGVPHFVYTGHAALASLDYPGFDARDLMRRWLPLESSIYANAATVFTHSEHTSRWLVEGYGCPPERVVCVHSGGNPPAPSAPPCFDEARYAAKRILFAGLRWEVKGGPQLVAAFRRVRERHPDATLTIVGCTPDVDVPNCHVVGRVPLHEMPAYYETASVFCLPTTKEAFGRVFVEALSHGLPVVATNFGPIPELVIEGDTGHLVDSGDVRSLADRLVGLLDDPARCRRLGRRGYGLAQERYNWETTGMRIRRTVEQELFHGENCLARR